MLSHHLVALIGLVCVTSHLCIDSTFKYVWVILIVLLFVITLFFIFIAFVTWMSCLRSRLVFVRSVKHCAAVSHVMQFLLYAVALAVVGSLCLSAEVERDCL